jgi:hypothetical protein
MLIGDRGSRAARVSLHDLGIELAGFALHAFALDRLRDGGADRMGAGAGVGAIIGGILGGFKGAMAGILIGGGGTIAATEGKDVELPAGSVLRVRLDSGLNLR